MLHTQAMRGEILSELQTDMQTETESLVSVLKFKPWVESKHRITKVTGPCQRAVCSPVGMNLN